MTRDRTQLAQMAEAQFKDMFAQSVSVLTQPTVATFERFERRGNTRHAMMYVMLAAVVSAVIGAFFAMFHQDVTVLGQLLSRLIAIPLQFFAFTGLVYFIGRNFFKGTGTYPEVAYTFALFFVPLSIVSSLVGIIPILGWAASFVIGLIMIFFGFVAVQSSMNIRDKAQAAITLVLSGVAYLLLGGFLVNLIAGILS